MKNRDIKKDLWEYLKQTEKTIVLYGMGNGADKIMAVCEQYGITVQDVFASDGFVRGHVYKGMRVKTYQQICEEYGKDNLIVLLSFGTSREDVLENILRIASECELYAPDVPVFGNTLSSLTFFRSHAEELQEVYGLLADEQSKRVFEDVIMFRITGNISHLMGHTSTHEEVCRDLLNAKEIRCLCDLGAYNGDTVREMAEYAELRTAIAVEPDRRNYKKLSAYAETEARFSVLPIEAAAWSEQATLSFDASGNRNANVGTTHTSMTVKAVTPDEIIGEKDVDYIKYDVEGAEAEALKGSKRVIDAQHPKLLVSLYHRSEDLYALPLLVHTLDPSYRLYLRRYRGIPAWDIHLICL